MIEPIDTQESRRRGPRLYHKKSRTGCLLCKRRHVKCDEKRPSCSGCSRHRQECIYPSQAVPSPPTAEDIKPVTLLPAGTTAAASSSASSPASTGSNFNREDVPMVMPPHHSALRDPTRSHSPQSSSQSPAGSGILIAPAAAAAAATTRPSANFNNNNVAYPSPSSSSSGGGNSNSYSYSASASIADGDLDLPETRERRLWELRLLHNQQTEMTQVFPTAQSPTIVRLWSHVMPEMALRDGGALLHIILASSALNLWHKSSSSGGETTQQQQAERDQLMALQTHYLTMCFQAQRRDVACLSSKNADYVCFTSLKIVSHSVALVQTLSPDPWEPPLQWLHMGRGADEMFRRAAGLVSPADGDQIMTFFHSPPALLDEDTTSYDRARLAWLLEHPAGRGSAEASEDRELEDEEVRSAYEKAISYTCSVHGAIERGEPVFSIVRRLAAFSVFVPTEYVQLLAEKRPRAMVILAHFMVLWLDYENIWLIGKGGQRQIKGILMTLPPEWRCKLDSLPMHKIYTSDGHFDAILN